MLNGGALCAIERREMKSIEHDGPNQQSPMSP